MADEPVRRRFPASRAFEHSRFERRLNDPIRFGYNASPMATTRRHDGRRPGELRPVAIRPGFVEPADGSCLIEVGRTRVICTASIVPGVPAWREGTGCGWVTAEYGMLPASTGRRKARPGPGRDSRGVEIQRLIGRSLRNVVSFQKLGENTVYLDCDVLQADGGTRTASITGAWVALALAASNGAGRGLFAPRAIGGPVAGVSAGVVAGRCVLDLDYAEDSAAEVDLNVAMLPGGQFVEVQGTGESAPFDADQLQAMLKMAHKGIKRLMTIQRRTVREACS
jgi:ribonuclease PH